MLTRVLPKGREHRKGEQGKGEKKKGKGGTSVTEEQREKTSHCVCKEKKELRNLRLLGKEGETRETAAPLERRINTQTAPTPKR